MKKPKDQFNVTIDSKIIEEFEDFANEGKKHGLFRKQGYKSQAGELVIYAGLDICKKQLEKLKKKNNVNK